MRGEDLVDLITSPGWMAYSAPPTTRPVNFIPNVTPDAGLSAPFNAWMTFFGQFFDHGLDLVTKGGNGTSSFRCSPTTRSSRGGDDISALRMICRRLAIHGDDARHVR